MINDKADLQDCIDTLGDHVHEFSGKKILIAGGAGFLGRHFIALFRQLNSNILAEPCKVFSVDNFITGDPNAIYDEGKVDPNIIPVWADVSAPLPIREDIDYIIQAAGVASPVYYMKYPLETIESAVQGTKNLMELARRNKDLKGFLYFSSSEIYGDPDPKFVPTPETYHGYVSSTGPRACYDESKRLGETISVIYHQKFNIPVKIVRPFNVFGPGMKHNDRRVVPMFTFEALNARPLSVHGDGRQTRTFCYISDAIAGFLLTLLSGKPGEAYNIGNENNEISMADLAKKFVDIIPHTKLNFINYPDTYPAGEPQRRCPDLTKAKSHFGYRSKVDLHEGLRRFVSWAKQDKDYLA